VGELLASIKNLQRLAELRPEIIVANNNSQDNTLAIVRSAISDLPTEVKVVNTARPGKSAAINDALKQATGDYLAFLDDDVVVDDQWLGSIQQFIDTGAYQVGQGRIALREPEANDPGVRTLIEKFRTIPQLTFKTATTEVHSLNGANFFIARDLFGKIGGFDERLGPGVSGTSEDVELARRLSRSGVRIGYVPGSVVYHRIDRGRLNEDYFEYIHRCQGKSRLLMRDRSYSAILFDGAKACLLYGWYSVVRNQRRRYRSKGRIFHYLGMFESKRTIGKSRL
jgi:GT2 family glycosyltransferase